MITPLRGLHADANCFHRLTSVRQAGILTADDTSLTFTVVDGQVSASLRVPPARSAHHG
jgi:hypothetical protein